MFDVRCPSWVRIAFDFKRNQSSFHILTQIHQQRSKDTYSEPYSATSTFLLLHFLFLFLRFVTYLTVIFTVQ